MSEFILEIGCEEMPARFVPKLAAELREVLDKALAEARLDHGGVSAWATPRRITAGVADLAASQRREEEIVAGPPKRIAYDAEGKLTKAGEGFAKTQGVGPEALFVTTTDKGEYLAARKTVGGGSTRDILPGLCVEGVKKLSFPKKMHWGSLDFHFGRPIRWFLALLDADVIPFELAGLTSGRRTWGHRIMGPGPFDVASAADYARTVEEQGRVVLDSERRKAIIREQGDAAAAKAGGRVIWKDSLLEEVCNLAECPRPLLGDFHPMYLELPREVLLTSMESHQKSFGVEGPDGKLLPHFLCTLNLEPQDRTLVKKGWERVLKARLEDARFFWESDLKTDLDTWLAALENVVFLGPLGSMGDKSRRLESLCAKLADTCGAPAELSEAGRLAKADLVSGMVGEFDTLQGVMGGIYAARKGKPEIVARAVAEQYLPAGPDSPTPTTLGGALLAVAEKADTLAGCFGLNMIPTGANDPYALRRCALGICRIVMEHGLRLDLGHLVVWAQEGYGAVSWKLDAAEAREKLLDFFGQRLRALFTGQGHDTRVVDAALGAGFADVKTLRERLEALTAFSREADFGQAVLTFKRAANIIRKQAGEAGVELSGAFETERFEAAAEKALAAKLAETEDRFRDLWKRGDFHGLLGLLRDLRPAVDAFFDNVMVMCEDSVLRENRLNLLKSLVDRLGRLADFGALQV
ncbi:glycine--tRNA ligase subunit beta [Desulfovibrio aminophilus]|uniref:glycine--tRNA ligase subunit beta n=1 Tax=Desulfovibrio aminophilus TaxID=81425 RepID=UPI0033983772